MLVNLGGIVPLSTVDWPGRAAIVIFLRGCPLRCPYCQNRELQDGETFVDFLYIAGEIKKTRSIAYEPGQMTLEEAFRLERANTLATALVISGGEPLMQLEPAKEIARLAKGLGLSIGVETSGYYPDALSEMLRKGLIDKVFLDIKAPLNETDYKVATGRTNVIPRVLESLEICLKSGVAVVVRNTIFPDISYPSGGLEITKVLSDLKAKYPKNKLEIKVLQKGVQRYGDSCRSSIKTKKNG
jgi:pyruvate formate lyase activating enzyme